MCGSLSLLQSKNVYLNNVHVHVHVHATNKRNLFITSISLTKSNHDILCVIIRICPKLQGQFIRGKCGWSVNGVGKGGGGGGGGRGGGSDGVDCHNAAQYHYITE